MAKTNIVFNNKNYSIDDSNFAPYSNALKSHFSSVMNGTGATINFGGTTYNIDSAKLEAARNAFVQHLGTVAGNGYKVKVGNVEYSVGSDKVQSAIAEIEAVLGGSVSGGGSDSPSSSTLEGDGQEFYTLAPTALRFRSTEPLNEFQEVKVNGQVVDPSNYTLEEGSTIVNLSIDYLKTLDVGAYDIEVVSANNAPRGGFTVAAPELNEHGFYYNQPYVGFVSGYGNVALFYREGGVLDFIIIDDLYVENATYTVNGNTIINHVSIGSIPAVVSQNGELQCDAIGTNFVLDNELIAADNDYVYSYNYGYMYDGVNYEGYDVVALINKNKSAYHPIRTRINGMPTVTMSADLFNHCTNMVVAPEIPNTMLTIPAGVFYNCTKLERVIIPSTIKKVNTIAFQDCIALTNIIFEGTTAQWNAVSEGNWGDKNVPATHVQCSDGQVAL